MIKSRMAKSQELRINLEQSSFDTLYGYIEPGKEHPSVFGKIASFLYKLECGFGNREVVLEYSIVRNFYTDSWIYVMTVDKDNGDFSNPKVYVITKAQL